MMTRVELLARALCRQYNRGFEDGTDDDPYGGEQSTAGQETYLRALVEDNWREWIGEAQLLADALEKCEPPEQAGPVQ